MDDELKKLIESTAAETRRQFEKIDERFDRIDKTIETFNDRFDSVDNAIADSQLQFVKINERFNSVDNAIAESRRQFEVVAENLDTKIDAVAEVLGGRIDSVDAKVDALATEMAAEFRDTRAAIKFSHHDRRISPTTATRIGRNACHPRPSPRHHPSRTESARRLSRQRRTRRSRDRHPRL